MRKIEIFRRGRYEMCDILYWPEDKKRADFIIVMDRNGRELIAHQAMGAWCELSNMDIIMRLRLAEHGLACPELKVG